MDGLARPRRIDILEYKHTSKWNTTLYRQPEPFTVTFDTRDTTAGCGVQHNDLANHSAAIMNTVIVRGGEPVRFPHSGRKIQFRIVVRCVGHFCDAGGRFA